MSSVLYDSNLNAIYQNFWTQPAETDGTKQTAQSALSDTVFAYTAAHLHTK